MREVPSSPALNDRAGMSKKSKMSEVKSSTKHSEINKSDKDHSSSAKKHKSSKHMRDNLVEVSMNGSVDDETIMTSDAGSKRPPQVYFAKLVECVNEWFVEKKQKTKPETVYRKHIPWKEIMQMMHEKGQSVKDLNDLKHNWFEVCRHIKVERTLTEILPECDQAIEKLFKIPTQSGYGIYQSEQRMRIRSKYPDMKFIEIHQKIAKRWNKLTDEQKEHYNNLAAKENEKNGVGSDKAKKKRKSEQIEKHRDETSIIENCNYPTTVLRDFYISYKAAELKRADPDLPYKKRRSIAGLNFSKCSFEELTDIKKKYSEHLQQFVDKVKCESPELVGKIGQHIMETKRLRPLLEQPIISRFLSNINLSEITPSTSNTSIKENGTKKSSKSNKSGGVDSSPSSSPICHKFNVVERYENSSLSSEEGSE